MAKLVETNTRVTVEASHWELNLDEAADLIGAADVIAENANGVGRLVSCVVKIAADEPGMAPAYMKYLDGKWILSDRV